MAKGTPVAVKIGGVTVNTFQSHGGYITIPLNAVRKVLASGQVNVERDYRYTDDYYGDAACNFERGQVEREALLQELGTAQHGWHASYSQGFEKVSGGTKPAHIHIGQHSFLSYSVFPTSGQIDIQPR